MQKVEIITGRERRRRWRPEEKARLVAAAFAPGAVMSHVARQHGVAESGLYAWRKQLNNGGLDGEPEASRTPQLIPVSVACAEPPEPAVAPPVAPGWATVTLPDGTRLEVSAGSPPQALQALIAVLRGRP